jgi:hypothetical protein
MRLNYASISNQQQHQQIDGKTVPSKLVNEIKEKTNNSGAIQKQNHQNKTKK